MAPRDPVAGAAPSMLRRATTLLVASTLLATLLASGCRLVYRHARSTEDYSVYTDASRRQLATLEALLHEALADFRVIFPQRAAEVPPPRVVLSEDRLVRARVHTVGLRQEGFYLPWLRLIHLSPREALRENAPGLGVRAVLYHELAHHYLVLGTPSVTPRVWLNEGLACALESTFRAPCGQVVTPLLHPWLHRQAHALLLTRGAHAIAAELAVLRAGSWLHYHRSPDKVQNYALSWAFTYYLLCRLEATHGGTAPFDEDPMIDPPPSQALEARVRALMQFHDDALESHVAGFLAWLAQPPDLECARLAGHALLRDWTLEAWVRAPGVDGARVLLHLAGDLETDDGAARARAHERLALLLNHAFLRGVTAPQRAALSHRLAAQLATAAPGEQQRIADQLLPSGREEVYLAPLIALLEAPEPALRASAAAALTRLADKPTITRPDFWLQAPAAARNAEAREWQLWLARRDPGASDAPHATTWPTESRSSAPRLHAGTGTGTILTARDDRAPPRE